MPLEAAVSDDTYWYPQSGDVVLELSTGYLGIVCSKHNHRWDSSLGWLVLMSTRAGKVYQAHVDTNYSKRGFKLLLRRVPT